jgi:hypothetical protein
MAIFLLKAFMMQHILDNYLQFSEGSIKDRFTSHKQVEKLIADLPGQFSKSVAGYSNEGRAIHLIQCGSGLTKVMLWSQMHGDEATGTMAIFDLLIFIGQDFDPVICIELLRSCTLYLIPMLNPDGAAHFTRRNAQQIDINRDYLQRATPEARILIELQESIKPDFGFNLHDQSTLWSVRGMGKPASLSFLAPAYNSLLESNAIRTKAMKVIAEIFSVLQPHLPEQIGLFDDEYEERAFGDNFQRNETSTILIEAGGMQGDPEKQELRKYFFLSILAGLSSIANQSFVTHSTADYFRIPANAKEIFHILIRDVLVQDFRTSIGLNYTEEPAADGKSTTLSYMVEDIGDLRNWSAYELFEARLLRIDGELLFNKPANFNLMDGDETILSFKNGILHSKR